MGTGPRRFAYALEQLHEDQDPRLAADVIAPLACWLHLRGARGVHTFRRPLPTPEDTFTGEQEAEIALAWDTRPLVAADPHLAADLRRSALGKTALLEELSVEIVTAFDVVSTTCIRNRRVVDVRGFAAPRLVLGDPADPGAPCAPAALSKMRARRLATLGDADDRWEATALLRDAAEQTLSAAAADPESDLPAAFVEAWALHLHARDPLRALDLRSRLPAAAHAPSLEPVHGELVSTFARALRDVLGAGFSLDHLDADQIRVLGGAYPAVPELWWALSRRSPSAGERDLARARALRLAPAFEDAAAADSAFATIESRLRPRLRIEVTSERRGAPLSLVAATSLSAALAALVADFTHDSPGGPVSLVLEAASPTPGARAPHVPDSAPGALVLDVTADGLAPFALEAMNRELAEPRPRATARAELSLLAAIREHAARLAVFETGSPGPPALLLDPARARSLLEPAELAARATLESRDVPQADDLERVFDVARTIALGADTPEGIPPRQNSYYRRAAKILGLLTETDEPTPAGRLLARLTPEERLRAGVLWFESSVCGDAWIRWSEGATLLDVAPRSAADFLRVSAPGLGRDTASRRAQTLVSWHRALAPHHYRAADPHP